MTAGSRRVLARNQGVTSRPRRRSTYFCRKTPADFDVDVYRNSTGDLVLGKSAAKDSRCADRQNDGVAHNVLRHRVDEHIGTYVGAAGEFLDRIIEQERGRGRDGRCNRRHRAVIKASEPEGPVGGLTARFIGGRSIIGRRRHNSLLSWEIIASAPAISSGTRRRFQTRISGSGMPGSRAEVLPWSHRTHPVVRQSTTLLCSATMSIPLPLIGFRLHWNDKSPERQHRRCR